MRRTAITDIAIDCATKNQKVAGISHVIAVFIKTQALKYFINIKERKVPINGTTEKRDTAEQPTIKIVRYSALSTFPYTTKDR